MATEGDLLNALEVANILNSRFLIRNEEFGGSSHLTCTKVPDGGNGRLHAGGFNVVFLRAPPFSDRIVRIAQQI